MKPVALAVGTRVRVLAMNDPVAVPSGTLGTVVNWLDKGPWILIGVHWDDGRKLGLAVPPDRFEVMT